MISAVKPPKFNQSPKPTKKKFFKKDFEVLNKYHIFQEDVLNNYIHDFFVNESLGSKLDLTDEKIKTQYRNSFDWFGYGVIDEGEIHIDENVGTQIIEEDFEPQDNNSNNIENDTRLNLKTLLQNTEQDSVPENTDNNNADDDIDLDLIENDPANQIAELLLKNPKGLKASKIAKILGLDKHEVNRILYSNKERFSVDFFFTWKMK